MLLIKLTIEIFISHCLSYTVRRYIYVNQIFLGRNNLGVWRFINGGGVYNFSASLRDDDSHLLNLWSTESFDFFLLDSLILLSKRSFAKSKSIKNAWRIVHNQGDYSSTRLTVGCGSL